MFNHILLVCTGNICRSPLAEILFKRQFEDSRLIAESAGIAAMTAYPADPLACEVAADHGMDLSRHRARQLDRKMLATADVVLTLDSDHQRWINQRFPEFCGKTQKLGRWQNNRNIEDPYRRPRQAFEIAYEQIEEDVNAWMKRLRRT